MKRIHCDLIKAWAEGAEIQGRIGEDVWHDTPIPSWDTAVTYRIKPETRWYRVMLLNDPVVGKQILICQKPRKESATSASPYFVKWLGEWQEVEL